MRAELGEIIDHVNGNGLDNRRKNLRKASTAENNRNRKKRSGATTSKYKGVSKDGAKWGASIWIGRFTTEEEAARAYDEAARRHFGEFACVNFPIDGEQSAIH